MGGAAGRSERRRRTGARPPDGPAAAGSPGAASCELPRPDAPRTTTTSVLLGEPEPHGARAQEVGDTPGVSGRCRNRPRVLGSVGGGSPPPGSPDGPTAPPGAPPAPPDAPRSGGGPKRSGGLCGAPPPARPPRGAGVTARAPRTAPAALSLPQPTPQSRPIALPVTVTPDPPSPQLWVSTHGAQRPHVTLRPQGGCSPRLRPPLPLGCRTDTGSSRRGARGGAGRCSRK